MTLRTKQRVVVGFLVVMTIWPLVHHGLVRTLDLNPWKWGGWSMYTTPARRVRARAQSLTDQRWLDLRGLRREQVQPVLAAYNEFAKYRMELGDVVEPREFARRLFEVYPGVESIAIEVKDVRVDRATAMVVDLPAREPYVYMRSELMGE